MSKLLPLKLSAASIIFFSGFTDVFMLSEKIPIFIYASYFLGLSIFLFTFVITPNTIQKNLGLVSSGYTLLVALLLFSLITSALLGTMSDHSIIHLIWFAWIYAVYGIFGYLLFNIINDFIFIQRLIAIALAVTCFLSIQDWASINHFIVEKSLFDILGRGDSDFKSSLLDLIRMRGPVEEGATFALYLVIFTPLLLLGRTKITFNLILLLSLIISTYALTLSIVSFVTLFVAILFASIITVKKMGDIKNILIAFLFLGLGATMVPTELIGRFGNAGDSSFIDRSEVYNSAIQRFERMGVMEFLFGYGPSSFRDLFATNPISGLLFMAHDYGLFGLLLYLLVYCHIIFTVVKARLPSQSKIVLLIPVIASMLHYSVVGNIWHPWIWILFPIIILYIDRSHEEVHAQGTSE